MRPDEGFATGFARHCAPPESSLSLWIPAAAFCLFWGAVCYGLAHFGRDMGVLATAFGWICGALVLAGLWFVYLVAKEIARRPQYHAALARWEKTWVCMRCGELFVPRD